jgi:hypothetical protein
MGRFKMYYCFAGNIIVIVKGLKDLAKMCNSSISTVSRQIRKYNKINPVSYRGYNIGVYEGIGQKKNKYMFEIPQVCKDVENLIILYIYGEDYPLTCFLNISKSDPVFAYVIKKYPRNKSMTKRDIIKNIKTVESQNYIFY